MLFADAVATSESIMTDERPVEQATAAGSLATEVQFNRDVLFVETAAARHEFSIELALTPEQQQLGLMFRRELPLNFGMLFVFDNDWEISMWMKNTFVSLDMIFIRNDGIIAHVTRRTTPRSTATIYSNTVARAVLEVAAGTADRLNIRLGDRVIHKSFS
jgi:uncharacterized protein